MSKPNTNRKLVAVKLDARKRVIPSGTGTPAHWWRVTFGKRWTGSSKQRRFFRTEKAAKKFINETVIAAEARGHSAFQIPPKLAIEAMELERQLRAYSASLTDAVKLFLNHVARGSGKTLSELIPPYLQTKNNPDYRRAQGISLRLFAKQFGDNAVSRILAPAVEKWLDSKQWKPLNRNNYHRDLSMFFRWAKRQGHVDENPVASIPKQKIKRAVPSVYTVAEAERLLISAVENPQLELLGMYAVGFFAGVRVRELTRMKWEMIDWQEGEIRLPAGVTKTGSPRNVDLVDALADWIGPTPPQTGPIVAKSNLRLRRCKLHQLADVPMKSNALRHSFASYHAAKFRDPGGLQLLLGQETPSVLFKHYIAATKKSEATAFFDLRPARELPDKPPVDKTNDATNVRSEVCDLAA
jgi:integrase